MNAAGKVMTSKSIQTLSVTVILCLPAIVYCLFDPIMGILVLGPLLVVFTAVVAAGVWFGLKCFKCSERCRLSTLWVLSIGWSLCLGVVTHHGHTAEGRFEMLLCDPIPNSVRFIDYKGYVAPASSDEILVFTIAPPDLERILKAKGFEPCTDPSIKKNEYHMSKIRKYGIDLDPVCFCLEGDRDTWWLFVNREKTKVLLHRLK